MIFLTNENEPEPHDALKPKRIKLGRKNGWQLPTNSVVVSRPARRGRFYSGIEWLACWLLDNAEGETITEQQLRAWATEAWLQYTKRTK